MKKESKANFSAFTSGMRGNEKPPAVTAKKTSPKGSKQSLEDQDGEKPAKSAATKIKSFVKPGTKKKIVHNRFKMAEDGEHYLVPRKMFESGDDEGE